MPSLPSLAPSLRLRVSARRSVARQPAAWEPSSARATRRDVVVGLRLGGGGGGGFGGRGSFRVRRRWRRVIGRRGTRGGVLSGQGGEEEADSRRYEYGHNGWAFERDVRGVSVGNDGRRDEERGARTETGEAEAARGPAEEPTGESASDRDREEEDGVEVREQGGRVELRWGGRRERVVRVLERTEPRNSMGGGGSSTGARMGEMGMTGMGIRMGLGTGGEGRSVLHYHHHHHIHYHLYPHREGRMSDVGEGRAITERVLGVYGYSAGEGISGGDAVVIGAIDGEVDPGAGVWRGWPDRRQRGLAAEGSGRSRRRRLRRVADWVVPWRRRGRRRRRRWAGGSDDGDGLGLTYEELLELEERNVKRGLSKDELDALEVVAWEKLQAEHAAADGHSPNSDGDGDHEHDSQSQPRLYRQGSACRICLDAVRPADRLIRLKCKHWYHKSCIETWFRTHRTCPVCRTEVEKIQPAPTSKLTC